MFCRMVAVISDVLLSGGHGLPEFWLTLDKG
jgi:hypothetical protein